MKVIDVHDTEDLFNEYKSIMSKMSCFNCIVQNDMTLKISESTEFFAEFDEQIDNLQKWRQKVINNFQSNIVEV